MLKHEQSTEVMSCMTSNLYKFLNESSQETFNNTP